jgi:DNA-binding transcriptional MerR regulator
MKVRIPNKLFFSITEVSKIIEVPSHVLRYWEKEFRQFLKPTKSETKRRKYQKKDIQTILKIKELLYKEKYSIAGAKKRLKQETVFPDLLKECKQELRKILRALDKQ